MAAPAITFHFQHPSFRLKNRNAIREWIAACALAEGHSIAGIHFQFCTDDHMLLMNKQYLQHDYLTDILTFEDRSSQGLCGDILISIDRVRDNAKQLKTNTLNELHRVIAHGVLHLMGYEDGTPKTQQAMRTQENNWLDHRTFLTT